MNIEIKKINCARYYPYLEEISPSENYILIDIDRAVEICQLSKAEMKYITPYIEMDEVRGFQTLQLWFKRHKPSLYKFYKEEINNNIFFPYIFMRLKMYLKTGKLN